MYEPNFHNFQIEYIFININGNLPKILSQSSLPNKQNNIISNLPNIQNLDIVNQQINTINAKILKQDEKLYKIEILLINWLTFLKIKKIIKSIRLDQTQKIK